MSADRRAIESQVWEAGGIGTEDCVMIVGADENAIVTQPRIDVATQQTGHSIEFWGRYFKNPGNTSPEQYQPNQEAALLNQKNIRVLPIGRQTGHVAGSASLGRTDGKTNAKAIIDAFGAQVLAALPQGLAVFLDVEGPPHPSLSVEYYTGWADGLAQTAQAAGVKLLPAVYGAQGDSTTWTNLAKAVSNGAACEGTWIARPGTLGCHPLKPFDESFVRPPGLPQSIKVLAWQAVLECHNLDFSILNPAFDAATLGKFVLPAVPQLAVVAAVPKPRAAPKARKKRAPKPKTKRTAGKKRTTKSKTKRTARKKGSRAKRR
jgi:hypothetical protein